MSKIGKQNVSAGPWCCESISATMIGHFTRRLEVEAGKAGGRLSVDQIRAAADAFLAESDRFDPVYRRAFDECGHLREAAAWEQSRRHPFDRVLMARFSHLFPARSGDDGTARGAILSRRAIPGIIHAMRMMLGPQIYEQCQRKCQAIADRHRDAKSGMVNWQAVRLDDDATGMINDVLVVMAHYFAEFEKRRGWFIDIVNSRLGKAGASDAEWRLAEPAFHRLMHALFEDLRAAFSIDKGRRMRRRYGDSAFETVAAFFDRLDRV